MEDIRGDLRDQAERPARRLSPLSRRGVSKAHIRTGVGGCTKASTGEF